MTLIAATHTVDFRCSLYDAPVGIEVPKSGASPGQKERALSPMMTTNLRYFLTEHGAIKPTRGLARRLAEHLTQIVVVASTDPGAGPVAAVRCRNKTHRRQCHGEITVAVEARSGNIEWRCPACRDDGVITNWQGTAWDRRPQPTDSSSGQPG